MTPPETQPALSEPEVFVLADRTLDAVVARIRDDQWDMSMPPDFARRDTAQVPTLRTIIGYHAYDDAWVPDMVAGRTMADVGEAAYKEDLLGADPRAAFSALVDRACAAVEALDDLSRTVHCSFGDFTAQQYLWQVTLFRGMRAHDIAKVIGADVPMSDALVRGIWEQVQPRAEEWRSYGVFPAAVPVPDDAPLLDRLLGLTGRRPDTTAA
jgi:uncharacterized protein (TIGR03086 family)